MKPILFNTEMVKAILEGRKTVTRRIIKPQPEFESGYDCPHENELGIFWKSEESYSSIEEFIKECPYGEVGDAIYVKETWQLLPSGFDELPPEMNYIYEATDELSDECTDWRPARKMPKSAARLFLKITDVRIEKLQDITEGQAEREGFTSTAKLTDDGNDYTGLYASEHFANTWDSIYSTKGYGWDTNPWVWVIEFERVEREC